MSESRPTNQQEGEFAGQILAADDVSHITEMPTEILSTKAVTGEEKHGTAPITYATRPITNSVIGMTPGVNRAQIGNLLPNIPAPAISPESNETTSRIHEHPHRVAKPESQTRTHLRQALVTKLAGETNNEPHSIAEIEAKLLAAEAKLVRESRLRAVAEAKAAQETFLRAVAEEKASEEERLRNEAQRDSIEKTKAIEEARLLVKAHAKDADQARAQAEKALSHRIATEKDAALDAKNEAEGMPQEGAKTREEQESRQHPNTDLNADDEAQLKASANGEEAGELDQHATQQFTSQATAESNADADAAARAEAKARNEALARSAAEAKLHELAALAAQQTKLRIAAELRAAEEVKLRTQAEARIEEACKLKAEATAEAKAARKTIEAREKETHKLKKTVDRVARKLATAESKVATSKHGMYPWSHKVNNAWFYTCEGNQLGPVTFQELRTIAVSCFLDPRLDMVWREGMETWKPAGQVDGLFEKSNTTYYPAEASVPKSILEPITATANINFSERSYTKDDSAQFGASRFSWIIAACVLPPFFLYINSFENPLVQKVQKFTGFILTERMLLAAGCISCVVAAYFTLRRLLDLGMNRWWILGFLVPILNFWLAYRCIACPSGFAHHKRMDHAGVVLAFLYWLFILATIALPAFLFFNGDAPPSF